jgi:hypothetical protein
VVVEVLETKHRPTLEKMEGLVVEVEEMEPLLVMELLVREIMVVLEQQVEAAAVVVAQAKLEMLVVLDMVGTV